MKTIECKAFYHKKKVTLLKHVYIEFDHNLYENKMNCHWGQSLYYPDELKYKSNFPDNSISDIPFAWNLN